ncbi:MAG: response regulator transcription factor [Saprospiraceae bacterium]|nr:response regulator transcription factor [Saprospiraceae bacterium]
MDHIKLCIVEDEIEFQDWILDELSADPRFECLGVFDTAEAALRKIPLLRPDIVLMDLGLNKSEMKGHECMLRLKLISPDMKFIVISSFSDDDKVFEALKVGAGAYIVKGDISKTLLTVIEEFYLGGAPMSPEIARKVLMSFHKPAEDMALLQTLSDRERAVLEPLSKGFLYKEIADMLPNENDPNKNISEGTVKKHAHNIYQKLQVNNRVEAIRKYLNWF